MLRFLHELVTSQSAARPDHWALCWKEERIPYGELDRLTNQLAQALRAHGGHSGDRVVVLIPNSANALFAVLGILKAGCIAVPIDITTPTKRLAEILIESQPSVILAARAARPVLDELLAAYFLGDHEFAAVSIGTLEALPIEGEHFATAFSGIDVLRQPSEPLACRMSDNSPALHFFTTSEVASGVTDSAGSPIYEATAFASMTRQPTIVTHAEVLAFLKNSHAVADLKEFDRVAGLPLQSPLSVAVAFSAFAAGAELHVVPPELLSRPRQLAAFVRTHDLTDWLTNHGLLSELVRSGAIRDGDFPSLRRLLWTGEVLTEETLRDLMQRLPLTQFARVTGSSNRKLVGQTIEIQSHPEATPIPVLSSHSEVVPVSL
jgi:acyl-CoA synthetase (AMP-forming)/AMP-acid ligase II